MQIAFAKHKFNLLFVLVIILFFSSVVLITTNADFIFTDNIYSGVTIGNIPVGGLSVNEAKNTVLVAFKNRTIKSPITLHFQNETWSIAAQDIELNINADDLALQAHHVGRNGNIINILRERYLAANYGHTVPFTQNYNYDKLHEILTTIAASINHTPQDALLVYHNNNIHITPEIWGQQVDLLMSITDITSNLNNGIPFSSELTINKQSPNIMSQDFNDIDHLIGVYTTQFNQNNKSRYQNIAIASEKINKILVKAGTVFSFNQSVGLRLPEYGYKEAPVFVDGKLLLDWGGGVCQVSTTLYNSALLADLEIEERSSHFQPPSYIPLGQDATVADNLIDFKFKNNSPYNIYITSEVSSNQITVSIFGKQIPNAAKIHIETTSKRLDYNTITMKDPSIALGKRIIESEGQRGFAVQTYRVKIINGQEISRENLSSDEYSPEDRVIRIGSKL